MERPYNPLKYTSDPENRIRYLASRIGYPFLRFVFNTLYGLKIEGRDRLRNPGPVIVVMNHCLHIEWFFIWHAAWPRLTRFTAEEANIRRPVGGLFNRLVGVIGIPDKNPMAMAPEVRRSIDKGELILFFPEGVLKLHNQKPSDFMIGAAWFACHHNVPVLPVSEILIRRPVNRLIPRWPLKVKIVVGAPLHADQFRQAGESLRHSAARMTREAEKIICETIDRESDS